MTPLEIWIDESLNKIRPFCSNQEHKNMTKRIKSGSQKEFSRVISELVVAQYYTENYPCDLRIPRGNKNKKDIDVSFLSSSLRINIEVKSPDLSFNNENSYNLYTPFLHQSNEVEIQNSLKAGLRNNLNIVPNKILNLRNFLLDCSEKFQESAEIGDINLVFISMLEMKWMDDYRIKIEKEEALKDFNNIHAIIISNACYIHNKNQKNYNFGLDHCINYIISNSRTIKGTTAINFNKAMAYLPNQTKEIKAWHESIIIGKDTIFRKILSVTLLENYYKWTISANFNPQQG